MVDVNIVCLGSIETLKLKAKNCFLQLTQHKSKGYLVSMLNIHRSKYNLLGIVDSY